MFDSCLQPMTEGPSNYFLSCSFLFVKLLLGYTSDLNLSADLQPVIAYIFKVFSSGKTERLFHPTRPFSCFQYNLLFTPNFCGLAFAKRSILLESAIHQRLRSSQNRKQVDSRKKNAPPIFIKIFSCFAFGGRY